MRPVLDFHPSVPPDRAGHDASTPDVHAGFTIGGAYNAVAPSRRMRRYDSTTCNRAISPQAKVANHATDTVMIKATNRKAIALLLVLAANMPFFLLAARDHRPDPASLPFFPVQQLACLPVDEMHPSAGFADNRFVSLPASQCWTFIKVVGQVKSRVVIRASLRGVGTPVTTDVSVIAETSN